LKRQKLAYTTANYVKLNVCKQIKTLFLPSDRDTDVHGTP